MAERTLTQAELNRALLARQLLLERAKASIPSALERMGGLQAQYAPSMYIGLWSRVEGLERAAVTRSLEQRRTVQATLMRATIHLVARGDYWPFEEAVRRTRRGHYVRATPNAPSEQRMVASAKRLRTRLAGGSMRRTEMEELIGKDEARGVGMFLSLVRVPPGGTWERRRADVFGLAEDWLGPSDADEAAGTARLVERYLRGFGPATRADIRAFTGLPLAQLDPVLERLTLRRYRTEDGALLLDLPRMPLPPGGTPAPVRFLPTWDAMLLVHARRTGVLSEEHRARVFNTKMPQSVGTFLVDGVVAGMWHYKDGEVALDPFEPLSRAARSEAQSEAERLAEFHA